MNVLAIVLPLVGVGIVALVVALLRAERKRSEAMAYASQAAGMVFEPRGDVELLRASAALPLFDRGRGRKARNVMRGRAGGADVVLFDYQYTVGGGQHSNTIVQTVALFPAGSLPDFVLAPENVFHRIGQVFGYQDIDFEDNPEFSSRYLLRGADEAAIRAAFGSDRLAFFASEPGWTVESAGRHVGVYRSGKRCKPDDLQAFLGSTERVWRALQ